MPGGFLKKLGTASCGMPGTSVGVARVCAATRSYRDGRLLTRTSATTNQGKRRVMMASASHDIAVGEVRGRIRFEVRSRRSRLERNADTWALRYGGSMLRP